MTSAASGTVVRVRSEPPAWRVWFALVAAPLAWVLEGLFGWFAGATICESASIATVRTFIGGFSVLMLALAAAGTWVGWGTLRDAARPRQGPSDRIEFMALASVFVSASFVIAIVWSGLSAAVLDVCGRMR